MADNGLFVYGNSTANPYISTDGINWTEKNLSNYHPQTIKSANGMFFLFSTYSSYGKTFYTTTDFDTFNEYTMPDYGTASNSVAYKDGVYLIQLGGTQSYLYTTDLVNYTKYDFGSSSTYTNMFTAFGKFMTINSYGHLLVSETGLPPWTDNMFTYAIYGYCVTPAAR